MQFSSIAVALAYLTACATTEADEGQAHGLLRRLLEKRRGLTSTFDFPDIHTVGGDKLSKLPVKLSRRLQDGQAGGVQPYQETAACSAEFGAIQACAKKSEWTNERLTSCATCIENALPVNQSVCSNFKEYMCVAADNCEEVCNPCKNVIRTFQRCSVPDCTTPCPDDPQDVTTKCENLMNATMACFNTNLTTAEADACVNCTAAGGPNGYPKPFTCDAAEFNLCLAPEQCGCGVCSPLVVDVFSCTNWCDPTCCAVESEPCRTTSECCSGLRCAKGTCAAVPTCARKGKKCKKAGDCCSKKCAASKKKKGKNRKTPPKKCG